MNTFLYQYQHLLYYLNPTAFSIRSFSVGWYSLMYLAAFLAVYFLLKYRIRKNELPAEDGNFNPEKLLDFLLFIFLGLIIGARLGYVIFYNPVYYLHHLLEIISPFDGAGNFIGLYGMSYHGGLIGVVIAAWIFCRKNKINFLNLANWAVPAIPAGYFFGRIGNFLNGELYGRVTEKFWGMYFPSDYSGYLRHPSQLYEAFLEGILLFLILWPLRNNEKVKNNLLALYLIGYALARITAEFFRMPDEQIGYIFGFLTLGQILSFLMLIFGVGLIFYGRKRKKWYN